MVYLTRKTKRLIIRPLQFSDYEAWKESHSSMHPAKNVWDKGPTPINELTKIKFRRVIKSQKKLAKEDKFYDLAVFEKSSGNLIGTVAAMDVLRGLTHSAFLGYFINNNYWGKGYGKEATLLMVDIAFKDIKLHRLEAGIEPYNRRSIMLARSIGLRKEGLKKRVLLLRGKWQDLVMYSATCEDFGVKWKGITTTRLR